MGSCVTKRTSSMHDYKKQMLRPPQDIKLFLPGSKNDLQSLKFEGFISNVKIQGDITESIGVTFLISDLMVKVDFPPHGPSEDDIKTIKWKGIQQNFQITANEYEIRTKNVEIQVYKPNRQIIQTIKINLYKVLTGPIKNNFKIMIKNHSPFNLIFDLKISEILKMVARVNSTQLRLKQQHHGEKFNFTVELILSQHGKNLRKIMTRPSSSKSIVQTEQSISDSINDDHQQPVTIDREKNLKRKSLKLIQEQKYFLQWKVPQILPEVNLSITTQDMSHSLFIFHCWKVSNKNQDSQKQVMHRFANFRVTLNQLFILKTPNQSPNSKTCFISLNQQMWSEGKSVGHCKCLIQMTAPRNLKQLPGLTRTQKGISTVGIDDFLNQEENNEMISHQQINISHHKLLEIKEQMLQSLQNNFKKKNLFKQAMQIVLQLNKQIRTIKFNESDFQKNAKGYNQLFDRQCFLLQILNTVYTLLGWEDKKLAKSCWELITVIITRKQLQLKYLGFSDAQISQLLHWIDSGNLYDSHNSKIQKKFLMHIFISRKVKIGLQFQRLLFDCLIQSLNQGIQILEENSYEFPKNQIFKAECFLKVPIFRQFILNQVSSPKDADYNDFQVKEREWLKCKVQTKVRKTQILKEHEWNRNFYSPLSFHPQFQQKEEELMGVVKNSVWIDEICERDGLFFSFLRIIIEKFNKLQRKNKTVSIEYFDGLNKLVTIFLNEMRNRSLPMYSPSLIKTSMALILNQDLQESILILVAKHTNYYDTPMVLKCLSIFRLFIRSLTEKNTLLPDSFCYGTFIQTVKKLLLSQSQTCVAAVLLIIYEVYQKLDPQFRAYITLYFLGSKFIPLFYHWSYVVRSIFHHFIILKISQNQQLFEPKIQLQKRMKKSHQNVLNQLQQFNAQVLQLESVKKDRYSISEQYYLRMKDKIKRRRKFKQTISMKDNHERKSTQFFSINLTEKNFDKKQSQFVSVSKNQFLIHKWPLILDFKRRQRFLSFTQDFLLTEKDIWGNPQSQIDEDVVMPDIPELRFSNKQYTYHQSAKYNGAFIQKEFSLCQITEMQINQISISHKQFDKINTQITKHFTTTRQLPDLPQQTFAFFDYEDLQIQSI